MKNVLIVDDNTARYKDFLTQISPKYLPADGVRVVTNVRDALELLREITFDIAIVDMLLPEVPWGGPLLDGGSKLLSHIEQDDELRRPKYLVGITAAAEDVPEVTALFERSTWLLLRDHSAGSDAIARLVALVEHVSVAERQQDEIAFSTDVCIITALRGTEQEAVLTCGFDWSDLQPIDTTTNVRRGVLPAVGGSLSVVAGCCSRMGMTESALLTLKLINHFRPRLVVMIGICAGVESKVEMGDVIAASPVWDYTSAKITVDENKNKVLCPAPDYISIDRDVIAALELLSEDKQFFADIYNAWPAAKPGAHPALRIGPSACGPMVVADGETFKEIRERQNRDTIALDMEAYGVYCGVRISSRPRPLVYCAKSICDYGDPRKDDKYQSYAAYTSARTATQFLRKYGVGLVKMLDGSR